MLKSPGETLSSKSGTGETPDVVCPGAKFLSICGSLNLENKLSTSKIQWCDRYVTDISISKGEIRKKEGSQVPRKFNLAGQIPLGFKA